MNSNKIPLGDTPAIRAIHQAVSKLMVPSFHDLTGLLLDLINGAKKEHAQRSLEGETLKREAFSLVAELMTLNQDAEPQTAQGNYIKQIHSS